MRGLLGVIRHRLGIVADDAQARRELAESGWGDVLDLASQFYWRIWVGPSWRRLAWYAEIGRHGMPEGSLRELLEYVFTPVVWNRRLSVWHFPRRSRGGRGLIVRHRSGLEVIG